MQVSRIVLTVLDSITFHITMIFLRMNNLFCWFMLNYYKCVLEYKLQQMVTKMHRLV